MKLSDFNYVLPEELIATHPAVQRDGSRLMHVTRNGGAISHHTFSEFPSFLMAGDCLVLNESRVMPARLMLNLVTGGRVELLLLRSLSSDGIPDWEAMVRPARKLTAGTQLQLPDNLGRAIIVSGEGRNRRVRFEFKSRENSFDEFLSQYGQMPLPPYILHQRKARGEAGEATLEDRERYQTVYAREKKNEKAASIAAPTAGLHFTPEILERLKERGVEVRRVMLHVGAGTFEPIEAQDVVSHMMHFEDYEISEADAAAIETARRDPKRRVVAVGTTALRALESCAAKYNEICPTRESTNLFIYPPYPFKAVDALLTNFHLPQSTLLMLVAAFAGRENILNAYREAVAQQYRFFSYGDAMFIE